MAAKWGKKGRQADKQPVKIGSAPERITNKLNSLLVAEDRRRHPSIRSHIKKNIITSAVIVAVIIVVGGFAAGNYYFNSTKKDTLTEEHCNGEAGSLFYKQAATAISNKSIEELKSLIDQIEYSEGYDQDVNCLYIATEYYLLSNNPERARDSYEKLVAIYDKDKISSDFGKNVRTIKTLSRSLGFLEDKAKEVREGNVYRGVRIE